MVMAWTLRRVQNPTHGLTVVDARAIPQFDPRRAEWSNGRGLFHAREDRRIARLEPSGNHDS